MAALRSQAFRIEYQVLLVKHPFDADRRTELDVTSRVQRIGKIVRTSTLERKNWSLPRTSIVLLNEWNGSEGYFTPDASGTFWAASPAGGPLGVFVKIDGYIVFDPAGQASELLMRYIGEVEDVRASLRPGASQVELVLRSACTRGLMRSIRKEDLPAATTYTDDQTVT